MRPKKLARIFALAALLLATFAGAVRAEDGPLFAWRAKSAAGEVVLFGSVHLGTPDLYPLPPAVEDAFKNANALAVEADVENLDQAKMTGIVMKHGMYQGADTLRAKISKETADKLDAWGKKSGFPVAMFDKMKPWMVAMTVTMMDAQKSGLNPEFGIDKHFLKKTKEPKKTVIELESIEGQLGLFMAMDNTLQQMMLKSTLDDAAEGPAKLKAMVAAWRKGDAAEIEKLVTEAYTKNPEAKPLLNKLFDERNVGMADKIEKLLPEHKTIFVVVGAGHLVGEKGVPALLKAKGFTVEQLSGAQK